MKIEISKRESDILIFNANRIYGFIFSVEPELRDIKRVLKETFENQDKQTFNRALDAIDDLCKRAPAARGAFGWLMDDLQNINSRHIDDDE